MRVGIYEATSLNQTPMYGDDTEYMHHALAVRLSDKLTSLPHRIP